MKKKKPHENKIVIRLSTLFHYFTFQNACCVSVFVDKINQVHFDISIEINLISKHMLSFISRGIKNKSDEIYKCTIVKLILHE